MSLLDKDACLRPERARELPDGSLARLMAAKCLRLYWHLIFDPSPGLLQLYPPDGKALFETFMAWAEDHDLSMDWSLHLHLLGYLLDAPGAEAPPREVVVELLASAASRWTRTDLSPELGILLGTRLLPGEAILAWKCASLTEPKQVLLVRLTDAAPVSTPAAWITLASRDDPAGQARGQSWRYRLQ